MGIPTGAVGDEALQVDRHFALYTGLEDGRPKRIPLVVRLYAGYHTHPDVQPAEAGYIAHVRELFRDLYSSEPTDRQVVQFDDIEKYDDLKDFSQLLDDTRRDHSLVFQLDEFWSVAENRFLADLGPDYWDKTTCRERVADGNTWFSIPDREEDPDESFQPLSPATIDDLKDFIAVDTGPDDASVQPAGLRIKERSRSSFFLTDDWRTMSHQHRRVRIPYVRDFGFLLAPRDVWNKARKRTLFGTVTRGRTVGEVWNCLCIPKAQFDDCDVVDESAGPISWSEFLEACRIVQGVRASPVLDVDLRTSETLCCLVLEMWFSEMRDLGINDDSVRPGVMLPSLREYLTFGALPLYRALRLLFDALPNLSVSRSLIELRSANVESIAARHWYSTATIATSKNRNLVPLRLPGWFSTRGDWFLCCAESSRSRLLAHRSIDKLTSRRMNLQRLHDGLGLPVRDIVRGGQQRRLRTALSYLDAATNNSESIELGELDDLGADTDRKCRTEWLWRSRVQSYDRHSFYFFRWLSRIYQAREVYFPDDDERRDAIHYETQRGPADRQASVVIENTLKLIFDSTDSIAAEKPTAESQRRITLLQPLVEFLRRVIYLLPRCDNLKTASFSTTARPMMDLRDRQPDLDDAADETDLRTATRHAATAVRSASKSAEEKVFRKRSESASRQTVAAATGSE